MAGRVGDSADLARLPAQDDTGVFEPRDILFDFLESRTRQDGIDLGPMLAQLFQVLDTPDDDRAATLDEDLARFPYVNGDLFEEPLRIPAFDASIRCFWTTCAPSSSG